MKPCPKNKSCLRGGDSDVESETEEPKQIQRPRRGPSRAKSGRWNGFPPSQAPSLQSRCRAQAPKPTSAQQLLRLLWQATTRSPTGTSTWPGRTNFLPPGRIARSHTHRQIDRYLHIHVANSVGAALRLCKGGPVGLSNLPAGRGGALPAERTRDTSREDAFSQSHESTLVTPSVTSVTVHGRGDHQVRPRHTLRASAWSRLSCELNHN